MATIREMAENMYYPTLAEKAACWDGANAVLHIEVEYGEEKTITYKQEK